MSTKPETHSHVIEETLQNILYPQESFTQLNSKNKTDTITQTQNNKDKPVLTEDAILKVVGGVGVLETVLKTLAVHKD